MLLIAIAFEFVNLATARFILRSRCAGSKGSGHLQVGAFDLPQPIHFAVSPARFVSHQNLGILQIGGFASMSNPSQKFQQTHGT